MEQTAVEFMVEELNKSIGLTKFVDTCDDDYKKEILGIIEKAKEIEKQQSIKFGKIIANKWAMIPIPLENIEDIYNETLKSE